MPTYPPLETMGNRIVILGPSNSGKSTLALAVARKVGLKPIFLDQFRFEPNTDWVMRDNQAFRALHDEAIAHDDWVMEGNYSSLFPQRFARATGIIVLGSNRLLRFWRYLTRTLTNKPRAGHLEGTRDSLKWAMAHWVLIASPKNTKRYIADAKAHRLPLVTCLSAADLNALYRSWGLSRD